MKIGGFQERAAYLLANRVESGVRGLVRVYSNAMLVDMCTVSRILVTGDRHWACTDLAERIVNRLIARFGYDLVVVHGGACGVDEAFAEACRNLGIAAEPHVADWRGLGNIAGPARNREMVQSGINLCVAFHRTLEASRGTKDCIRQALAAGIPVYLIDSDKGRPRRVKIGDKRLA